MSKSASYLIREVVGTPRPHYRRRYRQLSWGPTLLTLTLVISPAVPSPAHQVFDTAELLAMIVDYFNPTTVPIDTTTFRKEVSTRSEWKRQLAPLARVSKAFSRAAIEVLWETMDSLRPFLAILKSDYATEPNVRNAIPSLWIR